MKFVALGTWGIKKVHTDFFKRILKVKQSTPYVMLYGDLGRVPLSILYRLILQDNVHNGHSYEWLKFVKTIFNDSGLTYIWQKLIR